MKKWVPALASLLVAAAAAVENASHPTSRDADEFHASVRQAIERIPMQIGEWSGTDIPLPGAAQALLQPNATIARRYIHEPTGLSASLLVIQCRDTRDMSGHYPPNCYPGQGWLEATPVRLDTTSIAGLTIPIAVYHFEKRAFDRRSGLEIHDFFVLPRRGLASDMASVRKSAADHLRRHLGAAQVQILFDAGTDRAVKDEVVSLFLAEVLPMIDAMDAMREAP